MRMFISFSVLAKIHMVTKLDTEHSSHHLRSVLAKIHMVTKLMWFVLINMQSSVLAKIHMVTKRLVDLGHA